MKDKLITAGVNTLHAFGHPECNDKNIFTHPVYKELFKRMLEENKGHRGEEDKVIDELLTKFV